MPIAPNIFSHDQKHAPLYNTNHSFNKSLWSDEKQKKIWKHLNYSYWIKCVKEL